MALYIIVIEPFLFSFVLHYSSVVSSSLLYRRKEWTSLLYTDYSHADADKRLSSESWFCRCEWDIVCIIAV